jgi:hypothetical protein
MEPVYTSTLKQIPINLKKHGSWLYDRSSYGLDYEKLFDPTGLDFARTPTRQKLLEFKEYKFCRLPPDYLSLIYSNFCKQERKQDLYEDFGHALLEIIDSITPEDVSDLDIHDLSNWYKGKEENPQTIKIHFVIKNTLAGMSPKLHQQLIDQKDPLIRKRLLLMTYSLDNSKIKVVKNTDPIFDKIDEELLSRVDTYIKEDIETRTMALEQLVWDLYENFSNLDIHDPLSWYNWYMEKEDNPHTNEIHFVIKNTLVDMSSELHQLLIEQTDISIKKRLVLMNYNLNYSSPKIVKNTDPIFDQIDEELLSRVDTYEKNDMKARYIAIEELVEDLHDEFDPAYKKQKQEHAQKLVSCIEDMNVEELKNMGEFSSYNLENVLRAKKNPREWLYSKVTNGAIRKEVEKINSDKSNR